MEKVLAAPKLVGEIVKPKRPAWYTPVSKVPNILWVRSRSGVGRVAQSV